MKTITIQLDDKHAPAETITEVARQVEAGMTSGYYPTWSIDEGEASTPAVYEKVTRITVVGPDGDGRVFEKYDLYENGVELHLQDGGRTLKVFPRPRRGRGACLLCQEVIGPEENASPISDGHGPKLAHRECLLRSALGGIGHLEDHDKWCIQQGDPDGGRSYRQSALEVYDWVVKYGV